MQVDVSHLLRSSGDMGGRSVFLHWDSEKDHSLILWVCIKHGDSQAPIGFALEDRLGLPRGSGGLPIDTSNDGRFQTCAEH